MNEPKTWDDIWKQWGTTDSPMRADTIASIKRQRGQSEAKQGAKRIMKLALAYVIGALVGGLLFCAVLCRSGPLPVLWLGVVEGNNPPV